MKFLEIIFYVIILFLKKNNFQNHLKGVKGLDYLLPNCEINQKDILEFIVYCKKFEDDQGFITQGFFNSETSNKVKFLAGPFAGQICKIISKQKGKINILIGNITTSICKKSYLLYRPV